MENNPAISTSNENTILITQEKASLLTKYSKKYSAFGALIGASSIGAIIIGALSKEDITGNTTSEENEFVKPDIIDNPHEVTNISDSESFADSFAKAREECGANGFFEWNGKYYSTLYKEEANLLSKDEREGLTATIEEKREVAHIEANQTKEDNEAIEAIIIYEKPPVAQHIEAAETFNDAFALARAEVGPGGIFTWNGHHYATYTKEEMEGFTTEQQQQFYNSVDDIEIQKPEVSHNDFEVQNVEVPTTHEEVYLIKEEALKLDDGSMLDVQFYSVNGTIVTKVDRDGNGTYETVVYKDENNHTHIFDEAGTERIFDTNGEDITINEPSPDDGGIANNDLSNHIQNSEEIAQGLVGETHSDHHTDPTDDYAQPIDDNYPEPTNEDLDNNIDADF
jgi:hypothetical protein